MTELFNRSELKDRRRELRRNATHAERLLWDYLRGSKLADTKFRRQASIGAFIVDFYAPSLRLAIELDGSAHDGVETLALDTR